MPKHLLQSKVQATELCATDHSEKNTMLDSDFGYSIYYTWEYPSQVTQKAASFEWDPEQEGDLQWTRAAVQAALLRAYGLANPVMLEASVAVKDTLWSKSSASP